MARGINKAILIGNIGADPELKSTAGGSSVCTISLATSEVWRDKQTGEQNEKTEWHRLVVFGKLAEVCGEYLRKGSKAYFEGRIQTRKWQDRDGNDRYTTEIVCNEMQMLNSRGGGNARPERSSSNERPPPAPNDNFEDDVPF